MNKDLKRITIITIGTISVGLGILGLFLPLLPTTPFLLLAAFLYAKSSQRFYHWLVTNRFFGEYIRNYRDGLGISVRNKIIAIGLLWITIGLAIIFVITLWWVKGLLLLIAVGDTVYILRVKTYRPKLEE